MPSLEPRPLAMPRRPPRRRRGRRTAMTPRPAPALEERRPQTRQTLLQIIMTATWPGHVRWPRCSGCRPGRPWRPCASRPAGRRRRPLHLTDAMALKVAREAPQQVIAALAPRRRTTDSLRRSRPAPSPRNRSSQRLDTVPLDAVTLRQADEVRMVEVVEHRLGCATEL